MRRRLSESAAVGANRKRRVQSQVKTEQNRPVTHAINCVRRVALPAEARVYASVGVPYGAAYYAPSPYYYYPASAVSYGPCGWGWHWVRLHWNRWGRWVTGHCRANW